MKARTKMKKSHKPAKNAHYNILDVEFPDLRKVDDFYYVLLKIDGVTVPEPVSISNLSEAIKKSGVYEIFTCHCTEMACSGFNETIAEHRGDMITFKVMKDGNMVRTFTTSKKHANSLMLKIRNYMEQNKVVEEIKQNKIERLIEEKFHLLQVIRQKIKTIRELQIVVVIMFAFLLALFVRQFF